MPEHISPLELTSEPEHNPPEPDAADDLVAVRELVLRAHPDVVPDLVAGDSVAALLASVEGARAAYARVSETVAGTLATRMDVPAGGGGVLPVDPALLPPGEKIRRGLQAAQRRTTHKE